MQISDRLTQHVFDLLCEAAKVGARAPIFTGGKNAAYGVLAEQGKILVEISGHNWRRVTILIGEQAGRKTQANPLTSNVYMVGDTKGYRRLAGEEQYRGVDDQDNR